jgi:hypothetical protein
VGADNPKYRVDLTKRRLSMSVIVIDYRNGSSGGFDWVPDTKRGTI